MRERKVFLTRQQSLFLRGIGILMVIASHYAEWYGDVLQNETLQYALTRLDATEWIFSFWYPATGL